MPYKVFDIETDIHGARVVVARTPLMPGCRNDAEINYHIDQLIAELDGLRQKMKAANHVQNLKPEF